MSSKEVEAGYETVVHINEERGEVIVTNPKETGEKERVFSFDMTFSPTCKQISIFQQVALPIIESVL